MSSIGVVLLLTSFADYIFWVFSQRPLVGAGVYVAPNASVVGNVLIYNDASIWYGAVLRGDKNHIEVGSGSNIQDRTVITTVSSLETGFPADVKIGESVSVGAGSVLTSCVVGHHTMIGEGSIIEAGVEIGANVIISPGSVVVRNTLVPAGQFWAGNPAKFVRDVTEEEIHAQAKTAEKISESAKDHADEFLPFGTVYQHAEKLQATR